MFKKNTFKLLLFFLYYLTFFLILWVSISKVITDINTSFIMTCQLKIITRIKISNLLKCMIICFVICSGHVRSFNMLI
jgi:hypothetical protein